MSETATIHKDTSEMNVIFVHSALDDAGLLASDFRVYCHLARRAGTNGAAYPKAESIAETCKMTKDTVWAALKRLEARNMLRRERRFCTSNSYTLTKQSEWIAAPEDKPTEEEQNKDQNKPIGGKEGATIGGKEGAMIGGKEGPLSISTEGNPNKVYPPGILPLDDLDCHDSKSNAKALCEEITAYWNSKPTLPKALRTTNQRLRAVSARSKDKLFMENWKRCVDYYAASDFHCGKGKDGWIISLSWFLEPDRVVKLLERIGTAPVNGSLKQVYHTVEQARMMLQPGEDTTLEDGTFFRKADKDNMVFELIVKP